MTAQRKCWTGLLILMMTTGLSAAPDPGKAAAELENAGKFPEAAEAFSKLIRQKPNEAHAYVGRGYARWRMKDFTGAIADFDKAIALNARDADAYANRAMAYDCLCKDEQMLADFHQAIQLAPNNSIYYNNLGFSLASRGEHDQAITRYNKAIQLLPKSSMYHSNRGDSWLNKGDFDKAIADFNQAIELDPRSAKAFCNRAAAWLVHGDPDKAIADATQSITLNRQEAKSFRIRGIAREAKGDTQGAKQDAERAWILGPQPRMGLEVTVTPDLMARERAVLSDLLDKDTPETRARLAAVRHDHALMILGKPPRAPNQAALEEAVSYAKSATVLEPGNVEHWFLMGMLFRELSEKDPRAAVMAEQALRHAVEIDPEHAASWLELGLMMADQKRGWEAMTTLEKALENHPARTAPMAAGLLCAVYALNDEGFRGLAFFQQLYAGNPEVPALGVGAAIMLNDRGERDAAIEQARDIMSIEDPDTPEHAYAAKLVNEWKGGKP